MALEMILEFELTIAFIIPAPGIPTNASNRNNVACRSRTSQPLSSPDIFLD